MLVPETACTSWLRSHPGGGACAAHCTRAWLLLPDPRRDIWGQQSWLMAQGSPQAVRDGGRQDLVVSELSQIARSNEVGVVILSKRGCARWVKAGDEDLCAAELWLCLVLLSAAKPRS